MGPSCASTALLIKQTFHLHNSNVWRWRGRGKWVRALSAARLDALIKLESHLEETCKGYWTESRKDKASAEDSVIQPVLLSTAQRALAAHMFPSLSFIYR